MTLKQNREFQRVYKKGRSAHSHAFVLFYLPETGVRRIGFTASKKVGNAVRRNRCKRRMRSLFGDFKAQMREGSFIFVAKASMNLAAYDVLRRECRKLLAQTGGLADDENTLS